MNRQIPVLLVSVFVIAICGILYELLISSISSYFLGSSILHFSLVIGLFLSFMGLGSWMSRFFQRRLLRWFIRFEILLSIVGGSSAILLYFAYSLTPYYYLMAFLLISILGTLIGLEIPILTRIVSKEESLKDAMASVLSFDYLGSLLASVAFPLLLLPFLGMMRTAFAIGLLNLLVAALNVYLFRKELKKTQDLSATILVTGMLLIGGLFYSFQITDFFEKYLYRDQIMMTRQTTYQRIVVTQRNQDTRLFLNGNIQFSSRDEYRYHEPLVHIPMALSAPKSEVLILGGGDGLAARELLKYPEVKHITIVDLDPEMTRLGAEHPVFQRLNQGAMTDPRVSVVNQDAFKFIEESSDFFDVMLIDLPDPNNTDLGKLYSTQFYQLLKKRLSVAGVVITQSTSPYFAREAFWCIHHTLKNVFAQTLPLTVHVPSFGQWGFNLAVHSPGKLPPGSDSLMVETGIELVQDFLREKEASLQLKYLSPEVVPGLFSFGKDMAPIPVELNEIDNQKLIQYYEKSFYRWQ
ncbi:MAG: polyamine aminopropyltransferase [Bacteroidota bacterium]